MKPETNTHHLCPHSIGWTNNPDNLKIMPIVKHNALHMLFNNSLPHQQLKRLVEFNKSVFTQEYARAVQELLYIDEPGYIYKEGILKPRR